MFFLVMSREREIETQEGREGGAGRRGEKRKLSPNNHGIEVLPFSLTGPYLDTGSSLVQWQPGMHRPLSPGMGGR